MAESKNGDKKNGDKKDGMIFLNDFHAIDRKKKVIICNRESYMEYPIDLASALEFCPFCKELLPACAAHRSLKRNVTDNAAPTKHLVKEENIFCPTNGTSTPVGMGSACEICPSCGVFL